MRGKKVKVKKKNRKGIKKKGEGGKKLRLKKKIGRESKRKVRGKKVKVKKKNRKGIKKKGEGEKS